VSEPIVLCRDVSKVFRTHEREPGLAGFLKAFIKRKWVEVEALKTVDLSLEAGEFVGLIGPNGAGKTTLLKAMVGIIPATSGRVELFGRDSFHLRDEEKRRLGVVMGQRSQLWWDLPPLDSFELLREIYQIPRVEYAERLGHFMEMLGVEKQMRIQLRHLSLGQRMKMEIIGAFLHGPEVVFLDEPTLGLDLVARETIRRFLVELNRDEGATLILTSHDMEDIEHTCRRLVILDAGSVVFNGDLVELRRRIVGLRAVELHLEPGSEGRAEGLANSLVPFGARLVQDNPLALTVLVPAQKAHDCIVHLLDVLDVRDLSVERQPLENLIRQIYEDRALAPALEEGRRT
jgi:ABC-2 type transport system ATP-binding protein